MATELHTLSGKDPLILDGKNSWVVESGAVALFAVDDVDGPRHFLMRLDEGEVVLAGLSAGFSRFRILVVSITPGQVRSIVANDLIDAAMDSNPIATRQIETWAGKIGAALAVKEFADRAGLAKALTEAEDRWLRSLETQGEERKQDDRARLSRKQALTGEVTNQTLGELADVLKEGVTAATTSEGSPLLRAMQAVGNAQGIALRAPAFSDKRTDPVQAILQTSGVRARRVMLSGKWWQSENGPLLGFLEESKQPVALLPTRRSTFGRIRYALFNPVDGSRIIVDERTIEKISPLGLMFYRPLDQRIGSIDILRFVLEGRVKDLLTLVLTGIAATALGMLTPQATAILVDQAIPDGNRTLVLQIGMGLVAASAGAVLFELAQSASMLRIEIESSSILQCGVWDRLLKLSPTFFRGYTTGDLASRADAINSIRQQLSGATLRTIFVGLTSLLNLMLMFYYSPTLALAAVGLVVAVIAVTFSAGVAVIQLVRPLQETEGQLFGLVVQLINGVSKLRIAAAEERAFAFWGRVYSRQQKLKQTIQKRQDRVRLFNLVLPALSSALIFWMVDEVLREAGSASSGLALGTFLAFNAAFGTFFAGATSLSDTGLGLLNVTNLWKRARVILDAPPEVDVTKMHPGKMTGRVSIEHVTFRYREDGPLILDDVTIEAGPGECVALVGPSGSGKSTILNLLLRFEVPLSGAIYYDGHNLNSLDVAAVRRQLGVVLQENRIMAGSIFENIVCGSLCTLEDAWDAARAAAFDADIEAMPMKMHTPISEGGGNISGGQRQRLLIARALVSKPSILIFDEATSALDNRTQATVTESLRQLKVTTILVAHRLSTIRHADHIYVIEAGRVVQSGKFEELARQEGLFARLMARQTM